MPCSFGAARVVIRPVTPQNVRIADSSMGFSERIGITGVGLVTAAGLTPETAWERCMKGESGISSCRLFSTAGYGCQAAGQIPEYQLENLRAPKNQKFLNRGAKHLMRAAQQALAAASADRSKFNPDRMAAYTGSGHVGPEPSEFFRAFTIAKRADGTADWDQIGGRAARLIDPYFPLRSLSNSGVALLAMEVEARGPSNNFVHSDVSAAMALDAACLDLAEGRCDIAIVAGFDCLLTPGVYLSFEKKGLLSVKPPEEALRPFDRDSDGLVLGEGAGAVVIERVEDAENRGAPVLAEIASIATATDCGGRIEPFVTPDGLTASIRHAVDHGTPDFLVASGFGAPELDRREAAVLFDTFGNQVPVTAFKGLTGYLGAATAMVEIVFGVMALRCRMIPPVTHLSIQAEGVDLNLVQTAKPMAGNRPASALFLTTSWGGQSAAVCLRTPRG